MKTFSAPKQPEMISNNKDIDYSEKILGGTLPDDYKKFVKTYGCGAINNFLHIKTPIANSKILLIHETDEFENVYKQSAKLGLEIRKTFEPAQVFGTAFQSSGEGILKFGLTDNGDHLCWVTKNNKCLDKIVIYDGKMFELGIFNLSFSECLDALIQNKILNDFLQLRHTKPESIFSTETEYQKWIEE